MNIVQILKALKRRAEQCKNKKYNNADQIREILKAQGIEIYDKKMPDGKITAWKIGKHGKLNFYKW